MVHGVFDPVFQHVCDLVSSFSKRIDPFTREYFSVNLNLCLFDCQRRCVVGCLIKFLQGLIYPTIRVGLKSRDEKERKRERERERERERNWATDAIYQRKTFLPLICLTLNLDATCSSGNRVSDARNVTQQGTNEEWRAIQRALRHPRFFSSFREFLVNFLRVFAFGCLVVASRLIKGGKKYSCFKLINLSMTYGKNFFRS